MSRRAVRLLALLALSAVVLASCGGDDDDAAPDTTDVSDAPTTTSAVDGDGTTTAAPPDESSPTLADETTTTAAEPAIDVPQYGEIVATLAADDLGGRDNGTDFSTAAREAIIDELEQFTQPLDGEAGDRAAYLSEFDGGTNILALIPGTELPDEYVIVGAHYDHLGSDCIALDDTDTICNGATDNAAGVAVALEVGRAIATGATAPRRSVIIAIWDSEEDGLLGSAAYVAAPALPLESTTAYVNFDIQGANLSPALADVTVMVGAETGGAPLVAAATAATEASTLDTVPLSLLFGQGRSDHANFAAAGVPSVFFTDANGPCYHTTGDDLSVVDFDKLGQQIATAQALTRTLVSTDDVPVFDPVAPAATFSDAESMYQILLLVEPDLGLYPDGVVAFYDDFVAQLGAVVDEGETAFDDADVAMLLAGSVQLVEALTQTDCDGYLG